MRLDNLQEEFLWLLTELRTTSYHLGKLTGIAFVTLKNAETGKSKGWHQDVINKLEGKIPYKIAIHNNRIKFVGGEDKTKEAIELYARIQTLPEGEREYVFDLIKLLEGRST